MAVRVATGPGFVGANFVLSRGPTALALAPSHPCSGLSGSGKSRQAQLVTSQLLRLGSSGKKDTKIAEQVDALESVLYSFGSAKTQLNPSASHFSKWQELHFNHQGKLAGAKVLTFGLDKLRLANLAREERT